MRLRSLYIDGFRGALSPVEVEFGDAFTVITGRNGAGKSTICDAIEYVLTGTLERFRLDTEKGEYIDDYLWWRGPGSPQRRIARLTFATDSGEEFILSRGPDGDTTQRGVEKLYDPTKAPESPLPRLCQTSIIRDETITRFSTDLSETERFDFVNRAIGISRFDKIEERLTLVNKRLRDLVALRKTEYDRVREEAARLTSELSQARITASSTANLQELLKAVTGSPEAPTDVREFLRASQLEITRNRAEIDDIERSSATLRQLDPAHPSQAELKRQLELQTSEMSEAEVAVKSAELELSRLAAALDSERLRSARIEALAQLREQGIRAGLQDGHCPLCGLHIGEGEYKAHLEELEREIRGFNDSLTSLVTQHADAKAKHQQLRSKFEQLRAAYQQTLSRSEAAEKAYAAGRAKIRDFGLTSGTNIATVIAPKRQRIELLEKTISSLRSSLALARVSDLERQLSTVQDKLRIADFELSRASSAESSAREFDAALKRVSAEIVDERLADLSPLLSELYLRLRPHSEWAEIQYLMRGDVRRFLSFTVGSDINPRFVFSSGQRRALGLSFLLAVHLSRSWCYLKTLILDDPVQHIDDYRAMHLVEVLSSIRRSGRQVICGIEDPALADLLCRRLKMEASGEGVKVEMRFSLGKGISAECTDVVPLVARALVSA